MKRILFILLLIMMMGVSSVMAQDPTITVVGGEDDPGAVRDLLEYALAPTVPGGEITIYVGLLPDQEGFDLAIPESAQVIGSMRVISQGPGPKSLDYTQIYLASDLELSDAMTDISESLSGQGWWSPDLTAPRGFTDGAATDLQLCSEASDLYMMVSGTRDGNGKTRIFIFSSVEQAQFLCSNQGDMGVAGPEGAAGPPIDAYALLPNLVTPEGVRIMNYGSSGGGGGGPGIQSASTSVFVESEFSAGEIVALYNDQLVEAGWTLVENASIDGLAGSSWSFTDESGGVWNGILSIQAVSGDGSVYYAMMLIVNQIES